MAVDLSQNVPPRLEDRFKLVLEMATESDVLSDAMKTELKAMLDPTNLAMIVGVLVVWAGSHAFGVGLIFDAIMIGASIFMVGWSAWEAAKKIAEFMEKTIRARTMNDLKIASTLLATAIAILSVKLFMRLISKGAAGATSGGRTRKSSIREKVAEPVKGGQKKPSSRSDGGQTKQPKKDVPAPRAPPKRRPHHRKDLDEKWYDPKTGDLNWPDGTKPGTYPDGFSSPPKRETLPKGSKIDRYGDEGGSFLSPSGTPYEARALPYDKGKMPHKEYEVVKPLPVASGEAKPWFDQKGGGTQYKTDMSVQDLLDGGYIKEIGK